VTPRRVLLVSALLLAAPACSDSPAGRQSSYQRGLAALAAGRPRAARAELMRAIEADPNDARIRVAQARADLLLGDGVAAEAEIKRARQLGFAEADAHHLLAHAYLLQGDPDRAIAEANRAPPEHQVYAARMRGLAALAQGDAALAEQAFAQAVEMAPRDSRVWTDLARFRRASGEIGGAIAAADRAVDLDMRNAEALVLRGELTRTQYGLAAALDWFDRALEVDPNNVPALAERAATLADLGQMKAMLADTRTLLAVSPKHPRAWFLQALLAARAAKYELADTILQRVGDRLDGQPAALLLAGVVALQTGKAERAIQHFQTLVAMQPANLKARRLLGAAQWRLGDAAATLATLRPLADRPDADSYVLTMSAGAAHKAGDRAAASAFLARAADPSRRASSALLPEPVDDEQLASLRRIAESRPGEVVLQIRLIRALLGRGFGDEALARSQALEAAYPGVPDAHMLAGDALGLEGDAAGAAAAYRVAANLAFTEPVALRLIEALRESGDSAGAAGVLELFLEQNPQNVPAQLLAANALLQAGEWDQAINLYEQLRARIGNGDATLLNNLAWAYGQKGDLKRAVPFARAAWRLDPNNPATADTYGWLLYKTGRDKAQALALIEQAARGAPDAGDFRRYLGG
jgi:tetratricopeptide (TPR) repeat protein